MALSANELRIGNWIENNIAEFPDNYFQVLEVGETLKLKQWNDIDFYHIADFQPIPLTPEILEKCGFVKDNTSQYGGFCIGIGEGEQIRIVNDETIGWHWPMHGFCRPKVNYLHQLQNLIHALTGIEIPITELK